MGHFADILLPKLTQCSFLDIFVKTLVTLMSICKQIILCDLNICIFVVKNNSHIIKTCIKKTLDMFYVNHLLIVQFM